jgi:hypothetical protein
MRNDLLERLILRITSPSVHAVMSILVGLFLVGWSGMAAGQREVEVAPLAIEGPRYEASLDGRWNVTTDPGNIGLSQGWVEVLSADPKGFEPPEDVYAMDIPGALEARLPGHSYDGVAWYWRTFSVPADVWVMRSWLHFEQVNHACRVWLDGQEMGAHEGGYDAFRLDVSSALSWDRRHVLIVRVVDPGRELVDGLTLSTVPHSKESWYQNFGGILGSVSLVAHRDTLGHIERLRPDAQSGKLSVHLKFDGPDIRERFFSIELRVRPVPVGAALPGRGDVRSPSVAVARVRVQMKNGYGQASASLSVPGWRLWSPGSPQRYVIDLSLPDSDGEMSLETTRSFGFRSVVLDGNGFHLNGERIVLQGVLYQPHNIGLTGRVPDDEALLEEVQQMLDAGLNMVRAHVRPAPPAFLDAADRYGLMVHEEPAIGWVKNTPRLLGRLKGELTWMESRDHHHPSLVLWGVLNELSGQASIHGPDLVAHLAALDPTRPVLEDSGGFFGARFQPAGGGPVSTMLDGHAYPPYPLPMAERRDLRTLSHAAGPVYLSEYGYGTLVDTQAAGAEFIRRGIGGGERDRFVMLAWRTAEALASGEVWTADGWLSEAGQVHADMTTEMTQLLRSNPDLDGLVYTQWRGVSGESSAGLLSVWGDERPALPALRHALRPLQLNVHADRASVRVGDRLSLELVLVNDTGAAVRGAVEVTARGVRSLNKGPAEVRDHAPGVSLFERVVLIEQAGELAFTARLVSPSGEVLEESVPARLVAVGERPVHRSDGVGRGERRPLLVLPEGDPKLLAFAEREGFEHAASLPSGPDEARAVIVIHRPENLGALRDTATRLGLWRHVHRGGAAILFLGDLPEDHVGSKAGGGSRGVLSLPRVPVPGLRYAPATGNFQGRFHLLMRPESAGPFDLVFELPPPEPDDPVTASRVPDGARPIMMRADDASLAPVALLSGALPLGSRSAGISLNYLQQRLGSLVTMVPFGQGQLLFVGLPLADPIEGHPDPYRDRVLSRLIETLHEELQQRGGLEARPPLAWTGEGLAAYEQGMQRLEMLARLADRYTFVVPGSVAPEGLVEQALARSRVALEALLVGAPDADAGLLAAFEGSWPDPVAQFAQREADLIGHAISAFSDGQWTDGELAVAIVEAWGAAVASWMAGDAEAAAGHLDDSEALLASREDA